MDRDNPNTGRPDFDPTKAERGELEDLIDDMEKRVEAERRERRVPGNVAEREESEPTVPDDQAPD
ncbi:hypothetical protein [Rhodococcus gannanensis]|uniref:Uncharacterized protein n=1 Tax=Rhodococcus gannanensis TaxID=1960308 RepID=A0ABW4NZD9_9NOCA